MRRLATIPPDYVQRMRAKVDGSAHGTRNAVLAGAGVGLGFALVLRLWMRLITGQEPVFTIGGTIFIFVVVSGFGAAAGYAFAVRHRTRRRARRFVERSMGFVPMLGMGPFMVFFLGGAIFAWLQSRQLSRRWMRWGLMALGVLVTGFWTLVFFAGGEDRDPSLLRPLMYLAIGYVLYVSLRFALTRTEPAQRPSVPAPQIQITSL